ncbi:MAG: RnfABCDGE type electron transport complex subunit G [Candidatus Aminicenantes bacterium]|nr:RnfABCDGE type electron transport complex subunit G [Candidatus Aminicenantes bacterium]
MREYIRMVAVLTAIAAVCGLLLAAVKKGTEKRIEEQILVNVQGPALNNVLASSTNDIIQDREEITVDQEIKIVFLGKKNGQIWAIAFEMTAMGYKGKIGVMVGFDLEKDRLTGIGILTHQETPGLGARVSEPIFTNNFKDRVISEIFKVKKDNGTIDAVSGATISSRAVCSAVEQSIVLYSAIKDQVVKKK